MAAETMSSCLILSVFLVANQLRPVDLQMNRMVSLNMTCVNLPLAALSSRSDDRFSQLKLFNPPHFISSSTATCGKLDVYVLTDLRLQVTSFRLFSFQSLYVHHLCAVSRLLHGKSLFDSTSPTITSHLSE